MRNEHKPKGGYIDDKSGGGHARHGGTEKGGGRVGHGVIGKGGRVLQDT